MKRTFHFFIFISLFLLPGCGGVVNFVKNTFPQAQKYKTLMGKMRPYLQHLYLYDQFNTVALFDALWLSDEARTLYAQVYADMMGKNMQETSSFLRRQLQSNEHFISFYVLSTLDIPLSVKPIPWALHLEIDGKKYVPEEVKAVDLAQAYRMFFRTSFDEHKQAYEVKFQRVLADGTIVLSEGVEHVLALVFSNGMYYSRMVWHVDASGNCIQKSIEKMVINESVSASLKEHERKKKYKKRARL